MSSARSWSLASSLRFMVSALDCRLVRNLHDSTASTKSISSERSKSRLTMAYCTGFLWKVWMSTPNSRRAWISV